jgi:hypothetical protein
MILALALSSFLVSRVPSATAQDTPAVNVVRLPVGGLQPHCLTDDAGTIHTVYFKGEPKAGDLWYATLKAGASEFSKPIRVNSQEQSSVAIGTIRGPRLALGRGGRVHVVWNGSGKAEPKGPKAPSGAASAPMLYARLNDAGTAFEPQMCLARTSTALDGGGSVAADSEGRVFVGWHAAQPSGPGAESDRQFWVARSIDDGLTFSPEVAVSPKGLGACACCGTAGLADDRGGVHFLFRSASDNENRDMQWLSSIDHGATFTAHQLGEWKANQCPMSSASIALQPGSQGLVLFAWETKGAVSFARADLAGNKVGPPTTPSGKGPRKHPTLAVSPDGIVLMAWAEGTGWNKGGDVCWQLFRADGSPVAGSFARREGGNGLTAWNAPAAAWSVERFVLTY